MWIKVIFIYDLKIQQEVAANCHEFADYANLIGINSSCKMRWTGQWPAQQLSSADLSPQQQPQQQQLQQTTSTASNICDEQRPQIMGIDHQLHQQIQQQLCVEQFQLLSQLQVSFVIIFSISII